MAGLKRFTTGGLARVLGTLRFPQLFLLTAVVFLADLFVPDAIPLADEIFLALLTALLGSFRRRRDGAAIPTEDTGQTDGTG